MQGKYRVKLMSLKGDPRLILPTLEATSMFGDNASRFTEYIMHFAREMLGSKAKAEHIISAQAVLTCRKMDFIEGKLGNLNLKDYGRKLLESSKKGGSKDYLNQLAVILVKLDYKKPDLKTLITILQIAGEQNKISKDSLVQALEERGIDASLGDRLERILRLFTFAELIIYDEGVIRSTIAIDEYQKTVGRALFEDAIRPDEFPRLLHSHYLDLVSHYGERVEIWRLRNRICIEKDITGQRFDALLKALPADVYGKDKYLVYSSVFGGTGGIWKGEKYYYYLAIRERK